MNSPRRQSVRRIPSSRKSATPTYRLGTPESGLRLEPYAVNYLTSLLQGLANKIADALTAEPLLSVEENLREMLSPDLAERVIPHDKPRAGSFTVVSSQAVEDAYVLSEEDATLLSRVFTSITLEVFEATRADVLRHDPSQNLVSYHSIQHGIQADPDLEDLFKL